MLRQKAFLAPVRPAVYYQSNGFSAPREEISLAFCGVLAMPPNGHIPGHPQNCNRAEVAAPRSILAVDIGGSKIKILATGQLEPRKFRSGEQLTQFAWLK
jgi:hypothetical protein